MQGDLEGLLCADCVVVADSDSSGDELRDVLDAASVRSGGRIRSKSTRTPRKEMAYMSTKRVAPAARQRHGRSRDELSVEALEFEQGRL